MRLHQLAASLLAFALFPASLAAQESLADFAIEDDGEGEGFAVEEVRFRFAYYGQRGRGFQSQADVDEDGGSERADIYQPMAQVTLRQNERVTHTVVLPFDVVTAASPDALDAVSSASRVTEAGTIDVSSRVERNEDERVIARYGFHIEETTGSIFGGVGWERDLAEDNAVFAVSAQVVSDLFENLDGDGDKSGWRAKYAINGNVSLSQLLSPTTIAAISYGLTYQRGVLQRTWNIVPLVDGGELEELFPENRYRHAASVWIAQHVPQTRTTFRGAYRFYIDNFDLTAHTARIRAYQYVGNRALLRGSYRYYTQDGVSFFRTELPAGFDRGMPRTADSDLAPFDAHELGAKLQFFLTPAKFAEPARDAIDISYLYYVRDNDSTIHAVSAGYVHRF